VAANPVAIEVMAVTLPVAAVSIRDLMTFVHAVKLDRETAELDAMGLGGVFLRLLDFVDHPGINHPTLLWGFWDFV
jgi:hypothetical protein